MKRGILSHHSQEMRDKPSLVLQVCPSLLQAILHPVARQSLYELTWTVLLPTQDLQQFPSASHIGLNLHSVSCLQGVVRTDASYLS